MATTKPARKRGTDAPEGPARTAAQRRTAADQRHRAAGGQRVSVWLPATCVITIDRLAAHYSVDRIAATDADGYRNAQVAIYLLVREPVERVGS